MQGRLLITRRSFLLGLSGLGLLSLSRMNPLGILDRMPFSSEKSGTLVGAFTYQVPKIDSLKKSARSVPSIMQSWRIKNGKIEPSVQFPLSIFPHELIPHPKKPERFVGSERWTTNAVSLSLLERGSVNYFSSPPGFRFFGHAAFDFSGQTFVISGVADNDAKSNGRVFVYDANTNNLLASYRTEGSNPHQILIDQKTGLLAVAQNRENGNDGLISFMDIGSGKVVQKFLVEDAVHFVQLNSSDWMVGGGGDRIGMASISKLNSFTGEATIYSSMKSGAIRTLKGEALSLKKITEGVCAITIPLEKRVIFLNTDLEQVGEVLFDHKPTGLEVVDSSLLICFREKPQLMIEKALPSGSGKILVHGEGVLNSGLGASHLTFGSL